MTDIQLHINHWLDGNEEDFRNIFSFYFPQLLSFCRRSLKNDEEAEELVMNVMLKLWQEKERFKGVRSFQDYLFGMLHREMAGFFRKKITTTISLNEEAEIHGISIEPSTDLFCEEIHRLYIDALQKLPDRQREIFLMSREEGLGQSAIAEKTGLSPATVNNHITSALKTLRQIFNKDPRVLLYMFFISNFMEW